MKNDIKYYKDADGHLYCIRLKEYHSGVNVLFLGRSITAVSPASDGTAYIHLLGGEIVRVKESYEDIMKEVVLGFAMISEEELEEWMRKT